jgi:hypothetical protein
MQFCSLCGVMSRVLKMSMGAVGVMGGFFVIACFVVFGCLFVVMGGMLVMLSGIVVMLCCFFRHLALLLVVCELGDPGEKLITRKLRYPVGGMRIRKLCTLYSFQC